ncbi:MAG TPA: glycoside hydrolase family 6 protein, partial [Candidatus Paceibacterota bacterium]|nr:glycoside hydrolase family 6 protein [Candidatus Paceibacterota bacterium]
MSKKTAWAMKGIITAALMVTILTPHYFMSQLQALVAEADMAPSSDLEMWWPTEGSVVTGTQPFMGMMKGKNIDEYVMYWQVDDGNKNRMETNTNNYPHKESSVDLSSWNWRGAGPYKITFSAYTNGNEKITERSVTVYTGQPNSTASTEVPVAEKTSEPTASAPVESAGSATQARSVETWWPANNATLGGMQPFKALVPELSVEKYDMYWQVDDGNLNIMPTSNQDYPHKEVSVNVDAWRWRGAGPYKITFVAKDKAGAIIGKDERTITIAGGSSQTPTVSEPVATPTVTKTTTITTTSASGLKLYVNPNSPAKGIDKIASQPVAVWLGGWSNIGNDVGGVMSAAKSQGAVPTFVAYNIPQRDCGGYSAGGTGSADAYKSWISSIANTIGGGKAIVILEPDALSQITCLSGSDQERRYDMLKSAVSILKSKGNISVYIDAGHSGWISDTDMGNRLKKAGIDSADGFSLNVSNFKPTAEEVRYGQQLSSKVGGK